MTPLPEEHQRTARLEDLPTGTRFTLTASVVISTSEGVLINIEQPDDTVLAETVYADPLVTVIEESS